MSKSSYGKFDKSPGVSFSTQACFRAFRISYHLGCQTFKSLETNISAQPKGPIDKSKALETGRKMKLLSSHARAPQKVYVSTHSPCTRYMHQGVNRFLNTIMNKRTFIITLVIELWLLHWILRLNNLNTLITPLNIPFCLFSWGFSGNFLKKIHVLTQLNTPAEYPEYSNQAPFP